MLSGLAFGIGTAVPSGCGITPAEVQLNAGDVICFGAGERMGVLHTPGHPAGGVCYALYDSVVDELFALPGATRAWAGHGRSMEDFATLMAALKLPKPKPIDIAVPANRNLGLPHGACAGNGEAALEAASRCAASLRCCVAQVSETDVTALSR